MGKPEHLRRMRPQSGKKQTRQRRRHLGFGGEKHIKLTDRVVIWHDTNGISYGAGRRHVEIIWKQLQMVEAKPATTPGLKEEGRTGENQDVALGGQRGNKLQGVSGQM